MADGKQRGSQDVGMQFKGVLIKHIIMNLVLIITCIFASPQKLACAEEKSMNPLDYQFVDTNDNVLNSILKFPAGSNQMVKLVIRNHGKTVKIRLGITNMQTNDEGEIDTIASQQRLVSGAIKASAVFKEDNFAHEFILKSEDEKKIPFEILVPSKPFSGVQSFQVNIISESIDTSTMEASIRQSARLDLMNTTQQLPVPEVAFSNLKATNFLGRTGFLVTVKNSVGNDLIAQSLLAQIYSEKNGTLVASRRLNPIHMAPRSYFKFFVPALTLVTQDYRARMTLVQNGKTEEQNFAIHVQRPPQGAASQQAITQVAWTRRFFLILIIIGPIAIITIQIVRWYQYERKKVIKY
ncbi:DUF916 and DUF3324 domain-containing protein [Lacticaseibacillus paracasei]|uniref:DUF916 and DUF3324 domain-containing protein n=1 Tax=Lacticaseibacillus paracasei TaxID=1597 RepID=UPI0021D2855F|nr:DUF916 and DUF3324 domain-containing protein [Lacticaseibacillus paracasei]MCU6431184.1 DUF916 and DUF3324 domain-containing protein [Lacticaseibacillus paracasei]